MSLQLSALEVLNTLAFLLCVTFCAYVIGIMVIFLRPRTASDGDPSSYTWHLLVPCRDEATVVVETVRALRRTFPEATVWCVDDASTDGTGELLDQLAADPRIRVVHRRLPEARQGKGAALNAGWRAIRSATPADADRDRIIVGVVDADSRLDPRCLAALAGRRYFGRSGVSAIQIEVRMLNCGRTRSRVARRPWSQLLIRLQDMEFRGPIAAMQELRRHTGSVGMGGNGQFTRLAMLDRIADRHGTPWHGALLEDFELGLHVLLVGGRTEYCPETWVAQEALTKLRRLVRQRTRWAQGSMQCARYTWAVLTSRHIRNTGAAEIAYFLAAPWTQLVGTLVYLGCFAVLGYYVGQAPDSLAGWWRHGGWGVVPLIVVFGILPFATWGLIYRHRCDRSLSIPAALGLGLGHWLNSYVQCVAVWWAFFRLVGARSDWHKTARSRDAVRAALTRRVAPPHH
ncbi:glycosyltransferase family 2 protein [Micromonospora sp. WMMD1102]|uniref:glycosyltransferase family 2 protein n=1 Tax=Micromonospora sp. WMMD1102 TaxID=3016105 RepID=UPI0024155710|nr:glycosyltransferase family 2 protein [Micromonospora sp. WMMD1102]MDG4786352.1 glycosyltransferase family 2 protein [Micromonospora sp. WMMD1102]